MKYLPLLSLALSLAQAYSNNPPIPGRKPGYTYGTNKCGVQFELVYDLLCSDTFESDPHFQEFLKRPFLTSTVADQIAVTYTFFPLPYHHEVWVVHKLLPFFEDQCRSDPPNCQYYEYTNYTLNHQNEVLSAKTSSQKQIIQNWTQQVAQTFGFTQQDLLDVFEKNTNSAEMRTRYMWKYAAARQITGTPMAIVNGVLIQNFPKNADEWMQLLQDTYNSQFPKPSEEL